MNDAWEGVWGADWRHQQIDFTDSRTIVLAPDIVYTIRQYTAVVTDTAGTVLPQTSGGETLVWVKLAAVRVVMAVAPHQPTDVLTH